MLKKDFGKNFKRLRERTKLNQAELALELEKLSGNSYTRSNISKWEVGDAIPPLTLLPVLSTIFNTSILDFFHTDASKIENKNSNSDISLELAEVNREYELNPEASFKSLMTLVDEIYFKLKTCQEENENLKERLEVIVKVSTKGI